MYHRKNIIIMFHKKNIIMYHKKNIIIMYHKNIIIMYHKKNIIICTTRRTSSSCTTRRTSHSTTNCSGRTTFVDHKQVVDEKKKDLIYPGTREYIKKILPKVPTYKPYQSPVNINISYNMKSNFASDDVISDNK